MTGLLIATSLPLADGESKKDDPAARKLYEASQHQLREAKTLKVEVETKFERKDQPAATIQGTLIFATGNRVRADVKSRLPVKRTVAREGRDGKLTESTTFAINPKLDDKTFQLPN